MKWMVLLLGILAGLWLLKRNAERREAARQMPPQAKPRLSVTEPMVACAHCGVHVPDHELVKGLEGVYCSPVHQKVHEGVR